MTRRTLVLGLLCACGGGGSGDDVVDAGPDATAGPALELPEVIDFPYVAAGAGAATVTVMASDPGTAEVSGLTWSIDGDAAFTILDAPEQIAAGGEAPVTLRWAGAEARAIAGATLVVDGPLGMRTAELWAVADVAELGEADFAPVTGAGGVTIGDSAVVSMPTAPYPAAGRPWTDDHVHLFVPDGYRERDAHDLVLHFHGHSTTIDATVPGHHYREHVYASGADVILLVPQGPVDTASGNFGKLMDPAGTAAFLEEALIVLFRAGRITRPVLGQVTLTSHSGGYAAVASNIGGDQTFVVAQIDLFDSLYGYLSTYLDYALSGGLLRSNYTSSGGTDGNNLSLAAMLDDAGDPAADAATQRNLAAAAPVVYFTAASHTGSTRDDGAYGEQLRWRAPHSRRGPRAELRTVTASGATATATWLAQTDEDVTGWRVQTSADGVDWTTAAEAAAAARSADFALAAGTRVRLVPVVTGVADADVQPSDVYRVAPDADVLIVDGFDRVIDGSWGGLAHDFAARVGEAAGAVHTASNEAITEDGFDLSAYRAVIWLVGDESVDDHSFTAAERAAIDAYLDGGGHIVLSGSEIGYELGASGAGAAWLAATAGAIQASDDADSLTVDGAGPLAALTGVGFAGPSAPYAEEFPDAFTATGGGAVLLRYGSGSAAAVGLAGRGALVGFPL
ncbi:MAG TPA: hypothetical protein VL172_07680, partial [Kofleriaceae bacterium]|nr:hypothetical protein [Kofleriaceae bacterium]